MAYWRAAAAALAVLLACASAKAAPTDPSDATSIEAAGEDIVVAADGTYVDTVHNEIKATNDAGAMQASRISVLYDSELQDVEIVEAHTLKADGSKIPVDINTIYEQLPPDNTLAVTSFRIKVLLFPQFAAGDTAVYTVRYKTTKPNFAGEFTYGKYFPRGYPLKNTHVAITAPKSMHLRTETHDVPFVKSEQGDSETFTWTITAPKTKVPAQGAINPYDREPRFFVSSFKDYAALGAAYAAQAIPKAAVTPKIKALADQITTGVSDRREQTRLLYEWVVKHIRYVAIELGRGSFIPHEADAIVAKGYGDCKDHDTILQALLKAKGIAAQSMLINAENSYDTSVAPTFAQLNHVITYVPELDLWLDATAVAPFGVLPIEEYGKPVVRATQTSAGMTTVPVLAPDVAELATVTTATLDDKGVISGTTRTTAKGPHAIMLRYVALGVQAVGPDKVVQGRLAAAGFTDITGSFAMDPPMELTPSYSITGTFSAKGLADWLDHGEKRAMPRGLKLGAMIGDGMMGPYDLGDLTDTDPTACYSGRETEDISLVLPTGTTPNGLPDDFKVQTANLFFFAHWSFRNGIVTVHREFRSKVKVVSCTMDLRKETAATLKKIADNYDGGFRLSRSVDTYNSKIKAEPTNIDALIQRGNAYGDKGDYDAALKDYEEALRLDPKSSWALNARGTTYLDMGKIDLAIADYNRALALEPDFEEVWYNRALAYSHQSAWDKAIADFSQALKLNPKKIDALIDRGRAYMFEQKLDLAAADLDAAIALQPNHGRAHSNRAALHLRKADIQGAMADATAAIKADPKDTWALVLRGTAWRMKFNNEAALADFSAALAIDPRYADALKARAYLYRDTGRATLALPDLDTLIAATPDDADMLLMRARVHQSLRHWDLAIADYDRVLANRPDSEPAHSGRLAVMVDKGQSAEAFREAEALIAAHPGKGWPYMVRSMVKRELGDDKSANQDVALALKIEPGISPTISSTQIFRLPPKPANLPGYAATFAEGMQAMAQRQYDTAAASFERAVRQGAPDASVLPMLCKALAHTARLDEAAYHCSRALQLQENNGDLLEMRGLAYFRQGKFRDALADFNQAATVFSRDARYLYERGVTKKKLGDASGDADIAKAKKMDADVTGEVPSKIAP